MGMTRLRASFAAAFQGLVWALRTQQNLRIHAAAAILVTILGFLLQIPLISAAVLALTMAFVISLELANTAIEAVVDLLSPEYHPLAGRAKDVAAAAVLVASMGAVAVGSLILGPRLWTAFFPLLAG